MTADPDQQQNKRGETAGNKRIRPCARPSGAAPAEPQ
jgi:hypothetical protein